MDRARVGLLLFGLGVVCIAFVLGGNIYELVVVIPGWQRPGGLEAWRAFTGERHAGYFFLFFAPASLLLHVAGTAVGWNRPPARNPYALYATLVVLGAFIFTNVFFMPRNMLLFIPATATHDAAEASRILGQWIIGNYFRVGATLTGLGAGLIALRK